MRDKIKTTIQAQDMFDITLDLHNKNVVICFTGPFSQGITEELGASLRKHLKKEKRHPSLLIDIFSVFIEQTQNVQNYLADKAFPDNEMIHLNSGIAAIEKSDNDYIVISGNFVEKTDTKALIDWIETLNTLSNEQLKVIHKERLRQKLPPGSSGAGLGLVEIARRAKGPLQYQLKSATDRFDFFILKTMLRGTTQ